MDKQIIEGMHFALRELPENARRNLIAALSDALIASEPQGSMRALDPNVGDAGGGAAFLWEDVLGLGDVTDAVKELVGGSMPPNVAAKFVLSLLGLWKKLRTVRVPLSREQFMVMRAVKRGKNDEASIAEYTGLPEAQISQIISGLRNIIYRSEIHLIEDSAGRLITRF